LTTLGDRGRDHVMSTVDRRVLITLVVQLCLLQRDGRFGVARSRLRQLHDSLV